MSLQKLTKGWTEEDFKKFWRWAEKRLNDNSEEWWIGKEIKTLRC